MRKLLDISDIVAGAISLAVSIVFLCMKKI